MIKFADRILFTGDSHRLIVDSWQRERVERGFAGLDGTVSIDLGSRLRSLKQSGELSAGSRLALHGMIEEITQYIDGQVYELVDQDGVAYDNIRMDSFVRVGDISIGSRVSCAYEIRYSQLC